jgi:F0F1-type ATP synthase membrane subunit b/b'
VAKEAADSIGTYITKAKKHFASMRKQAEASKDKETLTALDSIDKHLAAAAKSHADMAETCLKDNVDGAASMECCKMIDDHLAKAISEHDKLMKKLGLVTKK